MASNHFNLYFIVVVSLILVPHVRSAISDCGDSIEGDDDISEIYIYNITTGENKLLIFPDIIFSAFWDSSLMSNNVCRSAIPSPPVPSFSTAIYDQQFNYSCNIVDSIAFMEYFQQPIVINLGKPSNCNCTLTLNTTANYTLEYITSLTILIIGDYTDGWLDYDWVLRGCEVSFNLSDIPSSEDDLFQQFIVTQSHYTPNEFSVSFWAVLGIMMGGALVVVSISTAIVSRKKDKEFFFNDIGGSFSMKPRLRQIADSLL